MRKNCARKWLHFTIDLLPLVVIPIFAIWSINHGDYNQESVINYKYQTNEVSTADDFIDGNLYHFNLDNEYFDFFMVSGNFTIELVNVDFYNFSTNEPISYDFFTFVNEPYGTIKTTAYIDFNDNSPYIEFYTYFVYNDDNDYTLFYSIFELNGRQSFICDFVLIDHEYLEYDFSSNVITSSTYNVIESVEVNDIPIGRAFYNSLIDTTDKYFNFDNVFNFGDIKQWFNTNFFSGNMPPIINSLFNIIFYEFVTDIMMLVYVVFMFFIDFATDTLERFNGWSRKG